MLAYIQQAKNHRSRATVEQTTGACFGLLKASMSPADVAALPNIKRKVFYSEKKWKSLVMTAREAAAHPLLPNSFGEAWNQQANCLWMDDRSSAMAEI